MKLLTKAHRAKLLKNHHEPGDHAPVVKLFTAAAGATWLLAEMNEEGIAYGLCDLGHGFPELGYVDFAELEALPKRFLLERDLYFTADKPVTEYAAEAREAGRIAA